MVAWGEHASDVGTLVKCSQTGGMWVFELMKDPTWIILTAAMQTTSTNPCQSFLTHKTWLLFCSENGWTIAVAH